MAQSFTGFPKDTFKFLRQLAKNNERDWFNANKDRYRSSVVEPVCDFIIAMGPRLEKISAHYVADPRPHGGSMFRIYRDTRFSNDKRPYKEHIGCQFRHVAGKDAHAPGFYVHIAPNEIFFGGGVWRPPNPILHKIRSAIVEKPESWARIINNKTLKRRFGGVKGDGLKRPPRGFDPTHPYLEDLKRKTFFVLQYVDPGLALTPKFIKEVERAFITASPLMEFVTTALELPYASR